MCSSLNWKTRHLKLEDISKAPKFTNQIWQKQNIFFIVLLSVIRVMWFIIQGIYFVIWFRKYCHTSLYFLHENFFFAIQARISCHSKIHNLSYETLCLLVQNCCFAWLFQVCHFAWSIYSKHKHLLSIIQCLNCLLGFLEQVISHQIKL